MDIASKQHSKSLQMVWNFLHNNQLSGSIPPVFGDLSNVVSMNLGQNNLTGSIPPSSLGSLEKLQTFNIYKNKLSGTIPPEFGNLKNVVYMSLEQNNLSGSIPPEIGNLINLQLLHLYENELSGPIPDEFGNLVSLYELAIDINKLSGCIPSSLGKLKMLKLLSLGQNQLSCPIPNELGKLVNLVDLNLYNNALSGFIPSTLGNMKKLKYLHLGSNQLSGPIPPQLGNLKDLGYLALFNNTLNGSIPNSFGNLRSLEDLRLFTNHLSGAIPKEMSRLENLSLFLVSDNHFSGSLPDEVCKGRKLTFLAASNNNFSGTMPKSLKNCSTLVDIRIAGNKINANITEDFGIYPNLQYADLSQNDFYGSLSASWGESSNLTAALFSSNKISAPIPKEIGKLKKLEVLDLSFNELRGAIPKELGDIISLGSLSLKGNRFTGLIPLELGKLSNIQLLDLSSNELSGQIPKELVQCSKLISLNLSNNLLNGMIPTELGNLAYLQILLDLSYNNLTGAIPGQLGKLDKLETLNLSHNLLNGTIPKSLEGLVSLQAVDLSYNNFYGPIPNIKTLTAASVAGNKGLCGRLPGQPSCSISVERNHKRIIILVIILTAAGSLLLLLICVTSLKIYCRSKVSTIPDTCYDEVWINPDMKISYQAIIEATEGFDDKYCIGSGGTSKVYKVELPSDRVMAVKKLHKRAELIDKKTFYNEVKTLQEIRHRNIVKMIGCISLPSDMLLLYKFMERGSLAGVLSRDDLAAELDWKKRMNVVKGVADALAYLHRDCVPSIVHRDISTSNILLDADYQAGLSHFGLARLLKPNTSNWTNPAGTYGYMAPGGPVPGNARHRPPLNPGHGGSNTTMLTSLTFLSATATASSAACRRSLTMSISLRSHAFAGSPLRAPKPSLHALKDLVLDDAHAPADLRVLPFAKGRPLAVSLSESSEARPLLRLGWMTAGELTRCLERCGVGLGEVGMAYLGSKDEGLSYWAAEMPAEAGLPEVEGGGRSCFVDLRTLMVATDWTDEPAMGELAVAGRGKALLEWHNAARFCGHCGSPTRPIDAGRRKECTKEQCKKRVYPRVDPVVIMLVIDKKNDRALLSRQSR